MEDSALAFCNKCGMGLRCEGCSSMARNLAMAKARIEELSGHMKNVERERDLAIAHDRQPYPTAAAYEAVCAANERKDKELIQAHDSLTRAVNQRDLLAQALRNIAKSTGGTWREIARDALDALEHETRGR